MIKYPNQTNRCLNKIFEDENKLLKSNLCNRGYKVFTVQSAIDVTSRHETFFETWNLFPVQRENTQTQCSTCHHLSSRPYETKHHPKKWSSHFFINHRMPDIFKDPPMDMVKRPGNLKHIVLKARLNNPLSSWRLKLAQTFYLSVAQQNIYMLFFLFLFFVRGEGGGVSVV